MKSLNTDLEKYSHAPALGARGASDDLRLGNDALPTPVLDTRELLDQLDSLLHDLHLVLQCHITRQGHGTSQDKVMADTHGNKRKQSLTGSVLAKLLWL